MGSDQHSRKQHNGNGSGITPPDRSVSSPTGLASQLPEMVKKMARIWIETEKALPPERVVVATKISNSEGERNHQDLKRIGRLWFVPDGSMYVYYTPTHWAALNEATQ